MNGTKLAGITAAILGLMIVGTLGAYTVRRNRTPSDGMPRAAALPPPPRPNLSPLEGTWKKDPTYPTSLKMGMTFYANGRGEDWGQHIETKQNRVSAFQWRDMGGNEIIIEASRPPQDTFGNPQTTTDTRRYSWKVSSDGELLELSNLDYPSDSATYHHVSGQ